MHHRVVSQELNVSLTHIDYNALFSLKERCNDHTMQAKVDLSMASFSFHSSYIAILWGFKVKDKIIVFPVGVISIE